ncbi:hypothetical protein BJY16_004799 [Actinoplanes octamycinicus]|uniref:Uncharacterized protein n=1 Tax=Actinoplanes octamycinicus TaxID=135948 RepID=A0A7W7GZS8_9ACTN|nr:hypothetical protein [Actinoplanes octamycinicus]MBB4741340.1 hypothetical protein [Actinoplanes octamycinicus]GIE62860.1 hypothetical protein Aoc01nite_82620 [Actinoplanes octamycinicus]
MSAHAWRLPRPSQDRSTYLARARALARTHGPGPWPDTPPAGGLISDAVMDGIRTHHTVRANSDEAGPLAERIDALTRRRPDLTDLTALHDAAAEVSPLSVADAILNDLRRRNTPPPRVRQLGRWLASHGTRRGAVAIGLVLLGLTGDARDRDLLLRLGTMEELTLYAAVALGSRHADLFALAQRVTGWGRIHTVQRLAGTTDERIRAWLLRGGFRNDILDQYLAWTAATTGGLADALAAESIDEDLLDGAGGILLALCEDGPAADITDYPDGPGAIERYLHHAGLHPPVLMRIGVTGSLLGFVDSARADPLPWAPRQRVRVQARAATLTSRPEWRAVVQAGLEADDPAVFDQAVRPAEQLRMRFTEHLVRQVRRRPYDAGLWYSLVDDPQEIDLTVRLAGALLPLSDLVTGPGTEPGVGWNRPEHVLDLVVSRLDEHPGKGWPLISTALRNATVRNRAMAVRALAAWPTETIPAEAWPMIRDALPAEPDMNVRQRMHELLRRR